MRADVSTACDSTVTKTSTLPRWIVRAIRLRISYSDCR